ncbi:serine/threonine protein kinase [Rhizobacter sp. AJA081-3]|uniref:serine/threonine-protein kinase n=1 Tax=Rhizobacter sp. AJA081-3 TaxID=2753607 RepID=UPI001AE0C5EC|nr:serine/threonine-protein kinase [Rhizobacter sp. AJA081-3]QTN21738.1 serine/threonine protein kinase [Rhizobacter sp. AJA081-3]
MNLARNDWSALLRLLDEALELPPAEREAWLAAREASLGALAPALRQLLDERRAIETGTFLQALPVLAAAPASAGLAMGQHIGPYALLRELGQGGMASVWLAERADGAHRREVALKLPWLGARARVIGERFAREREILSALTHPHIASVLDAGLDGAQPWLALEYVQGEPITAHAAKQALPTAARLRLFLQVLQAVQHAHAQLVIHRDIKPANVLVDERGQVKLLDFGVAKLLDDDGATQDTELTQLGGRAMTPQYASPEQVAGQTLGTASDVYSLGVLLHERHRPLRGHTPSSAPCPRRWKSMAPSAMAVDPATARALRGDIDTIVMKALAALPADRYSSAESMAQDIERNLQSMPIQARPASLGYRLRKALVRHRVAYGVASALSITLAAGLAATAWQAREARVEAARADRAKRFVLSIFQSADTGAGSGAATTALDLLRQARAKVDSDFRDDVAAQVELQTSIASGLIGFGQESEAVGLLEGVVQLATQRLGQSDRLTVQARRVLGEGLATQARSADAIVHLRETLAQARRLDDSTLIVESMQWLSRSLILSGSNDEAVSMAREATAIADREAARIDPTTRLYAWAWLANALSSARRPGELDAALKAEALAKQIFGTREVQPLIANHLAVGNAYLAEGRYAEAVATLGDSAARMKALLGAQHRDVAAAFGFLGRAQRDHGQPDAALDSLRTGLKATGSGDSKNSALHRAVSEQVMGDALNALGRHDEALAAVQRSLQAYEQAAGANSPLARNAYLTQSMALAGLGRLAEAERELRARRAGLDPKQALVVARFDNQLAAVLAASDRAEEALALAREASVKLRAAAPPVAASSALAVALAQLAAGHARDAIATVEPLLATLQANQHADSPLLAEARWLLGQALLADHRAEAAEPPLRQARDAWQRLNPQGRMADRTQVEHARAMRALGRPERSPGLRAAASRLACLPFKDDRAAATRW